MPEYTLAAIVAAGLAVLAELVVLRSGLFRRRTYWASLAIVLAFQVPVDGWLTKLSAPIVLYAPGQTTGVRWPWDIPVEDFLFGFAMVTLTLALWVHGGASAGRASRARARSSAGRRPERGG